MRKLFILLALTILSCSKDDINDDCGCVKTTYNITQEPQIGSNGLPTIVLVRTDLETENVECQDEVSQIQNYDNSFYDIVCDEN